MMQYESCIEYMRNLVVLTQSKLVVQLISGGLNYGEVQQYQLGGAMHNSNVSRVLDYNIHYNQCLGTGGYAGVFKCERQGSYYAVKIFSNVSQVGPIRKQYLMKAFQRERQSLQKLRECQNILNFYHYQSENDNLYLFTELCQMSLEKKIIDRGRIQEKEAVEYLFQIVNAYSKLYKHNIIHRDIKPDNILITADDVIKLADFGLSKQINSIKNTVVGTICYESPQLLQGNDQYTYKCDIWGIAMTFYEMLHGDLPYKQIALNQAQLLLKQIRKMNLDQLIDSKISLAAANFIKEGLAFQENERMTFEQMQAHPIFTNKFYAKNLMSDLRLITRRDRLDLLAICKSVDVQPNQAVSLDKLGEFLKKLNKSIDMPKIKAIFKTYKENGEKIEMRSILELLVYTESCIMKRSENKQIVINSVKQGGSKFPKRLKQNAII